MREWITEYRKLWRLGASFLNKEHTNQIHKLVKERTKAGDKDVEKDFTRALKIANLAIEEIGTANTATIATLLSPIYMKGIITPKDTATIFGGEIERVLAGMARVRQLYSKTSSVETENFRKLLLTFAEDVRVIFIILAERVYEMRNLASRDETTRHEISKETAYLYAPMAHKMGLYKIKTELEDLSMKFLYPDMYREIAKKLSETKEARDRYIANFITPLKAKLEAAGLKFSIKGRTKSINSIWNKMKKQNTTFEHIYDLFAIRVILKSDPAREKAECWQVYSIVADMYQPNPKRMRDWLSQPKANGYESLHTTVMGPEGKWVEVQIRTERMDEVAEKGIAAHWRYKGIQSENAMDEWLKNLREVLENPELKDAEYMDEFKLNLYDEEVFVFTPNGDLHRLPKGATLLDFAFSIHTKIGSTCTGGRIGNKHVTLRYVLQNGDQIEVLTSPNQHPHSDWINIAITSKAKQKIRQVIKEREASEANNGREIILRRFKNWKMEVDEGRLSRLAKKLGYKTITELYIDIARENIDALEFRDRYIDFDKATETHETQSAENFENRTQHNGKEDDTLIINNETRGVMYSMAKCCNPIFGDEIFGFVSVTNGIKIHRKDCPNAPQMMSRFGYRCVRAAWAKETGTQNICAIHVVGNDDVDIVTNISSIISKEKSVTLRSISIESDTGLFEGRLTLGVTNNKVLDDVMKKIRTIKGIKTVSRL